MDLLQDFGKVIKFLCIIIPLVISIGGIHVFFYSRSPKYYFKIASLFAKWRDTNWQLSVIYDVNKSVEFFKIFEKILKEKYGHYHRGFNLKNKKLYEFNYLTVTLQYDLDVSQSDIVKAEFLFNNVNVTNKNAEKMLRDLRTLFHEIEKEMTPINKNYNLNIKFNSMKNPFYGLMIQRLGEEHVQYFECVFPLSVFLNKDRDQIADSNYTLRVFKDYITINETDFDSVEDISKKCLLMG